MGGRSLGNGEGLPGLPPAPAYPITRIPISVAPPPRPPLYTGICRQCRLEPATEHLAPGAVATALGIHSAPPPERPEPRSSSCAPSAFDPVDAPSVVTAPGTARWVHVELALGLELHVRDDASPTVLALAERVKETCWKGR